MIRKNVCWLVLAAVLLPGAFPAVGDNPRIELKLANVTAAEAVARLAQASGILLELPGPDEVPRRRGPAERASFDWTGVPFARALRELCHRFHFEPARTTVGYTLQPEGEPPAKPLPRVGLVEKNGIRVFARGVTATGSHGRRFDEGEPEDEAGLMLELACELGALDGERVAGIGDLVAQDDQGNYLLSDEGQAPSGSGGEYPDEWSAAFNLTAPHPRARKLSWVEGTLYAHRVFRPLSVEVPLPLAEKQLRKRVGDWLLVVSRYQETFQPPAAPRLNLFPDEPEDMGLPRFPADAPPLEPMRFGPCVRVRIYTPPGSELEGRTGGAGSLPVLTTEAGRVYYPAFHQGRSESDGRVVLLDSIVAFPELKERPSRLIWSLVEKEGLTPLTTFRMRDIPLPEAPKFVPRLTLPRPAPPAPAGTEEHPFFDRGGGTLVSPVRLEGKPAPGGKLQVGLAARTGSDWGPTRWLEAEVDPDSTARILHVRAGAYRLLRIYRPQAGPPAPAAEGRWVNGEVEVTVQAGRETAVAALAWVRPAPAAQPAGRRGVRRNP